ncbi:MAG TPA: NAD-dependent epimerase/dehydratase family protein [Gemmatimonadales bacterium]
MAVALVTGATGLVGSHLVERLRAGGWRVRALTRDPAAARDMLARLDAEPVVGDLLDAGSLAGAARGCDAVVHAAALITARGGWSVYDATNVAGTRNVVSAARTAGARILHVSSVAVYGATARYSRGAGGTTEDAALAPLPSSAWYARSKRDAEEVVLGAHRAGSVWATAVRPAVVYGRRDRQFVPRMARLAMRGVVPVPGGGQAPLALVHAANVADAAVRALESDVAGGRAYNVANDFAVTAADFFRLAGEGLGRPVRVLSIPAAVARAGQGAASALLRVVGAGALADALGASVDYVTRGNPFTSDRARVELGWIPRVRPETGVPDAFEWWRRERE